MITRQSIIFLSVLSLSAVAAWGQGGAYPTRPIRLVVSLPPGGFPDYVSRVVAERLHSPLGQPVVVENKPGAAGNIAAEYVARQAADGYTLFMGDTAQVLNTSFFPRVPYDLLKDFAPVTIVAVQPFVLIVNAQSPVRSMKELIALARAKPGALTYGTAGMGSPHHFAAELLKSMTSIDIVHVPYKGAAGILPALLTGEISFSISGLYSSLAPMRSGKMRAIAVTGRERIALLPELPTIAEAGPLPGYQLDTWLGVLAPAGTPPSVVERLNTEINRIVRDPEVAKDKFAKFGLQPVGTTPQRFRQVIEADLATYAKIAKAANMKPE